MPVIEHYEKFGNSSQQPLLPMHPTRQIDSSSAVDEVHAAAVVVVVKVLTLMPAATSLSNIYYLISGWETRTPFDRVSLLSA